MGRRKLPMVLIDKEKSRTATYNFRKRGLKKKLVEFTKLCDVDACMIIYGPYNNNNGGDADGDRPMDLDTWPPNSDDVLRIINKYRSNGGADGKAKRRLDLLNLFKNRKDKIDGDIVKLRRANAKAKLPSWDERIDRAPIDQLVKAVDSTDRKLAYVNSLIEGKKRLTIIASDAQSIQKDSPAHNAHLLFSRNSQFQVTDDQSSCIQPLFANDDCSQFGNKQFQAVTQSGCIQPLFTNEACAPPPFGSFSNSNACNNSNQYNTTTMSPLVCYDHPNNSALAMPDVMYQSPLARTFTGYGYYPQNMQQFVEVQQQQQQNVSWNVSPMMMPNGFQSEYPFL